MTIILFILLVISTLNLGLTLTLALAFTKLISKRRTIKKIEPPQEESGLIDLPERRQNDGLVIRNPDYSDQQLL